MAAGSIPVISLLSDHASAEHDWVASDDEGGVASALDLLEARGHTQITYLSCPSVPGGKERESAVCRVASSHPASRVEIKALDSDRHRAGERAEALLRESGSPSTAVMTHNSDVALGLFDECRNQGISIPRQLTLVSMGAARADERGDVDLSAVTHDFPSLAGQALSRVRERLSPAGRLSQPRGVIVPMELHRGTTVSVSPGAGHPLNTRGTH